MSKTRILFVDDNPSVISGLQRMLRKLRGEWEMSFATSGEGGPGLLRRDALRRDRHDMQMPGMSGLQLLEEVVTRYPHTVRIVLTGQANEQVTTKALRLAHQFLHKPVDPQDLKQAIARACAVQKVICSDSIRAVVARCDSLPSTPTIYNDLRLAVESETANAISLPASSRKTWPCRPNCCSWSTRRFLGSAGGSPA